MNDTICAISTALGVGAISIIRVSGKEAIEITNKIFKGKNLNNVETHTIHYGYIIDNDEVIDEVLVSVMKAPKTFTMEDVVEINCHGGIATTNRVLELLLENGCRLAEAGEFTKRAFLNGRIDLMEAEAVMDLINTKTDSSRKISINQLQGYGSKMIKDLRNDLINIISNIEVNIDYPEYNDIYEVTRTDIVDKIGNIKDKIEKILNSYKNGKIIKDGINTVIVGRPNVGKSSILNKLLEYDKAIVTDIPGTTRDIVEGSANIDGITLNFIDTAGIRETDDVVEKIGVQKSLNSIDNADLVLIILNNNEELSEVDKEIIEKTKNKTSIIVVNKDDLDKKLDLSEYFDRNIIYTNTLDYEGIDSLKKEIKRLFNFDKIEMTDYNVISNARQVSKIKDSLNRINDIYSGLENDLPLDMLEIDLRDIWDVLGELVGESYDEELLDNLFSKFCVGK